MDKYELYIKEGCPICIKAVELLREKDKQFVVHVMDSDIEALNEAKEKFKHNTVPIVLVRENNTKSLIGGYTELRNKLNE